MNPIPLLFFCFLLCIITLYNTCYGLQKEVYVIMYHMRILEGVLIIVVGYNSYAVMSYAMLHVQC